MVCAGRRSDSIRAGDSFEENGLQTYPLRSREATAALVTSASTTIVWLPRGIDPFPHADPSSRTSGSLRSIVAQSSSFAPDFGIFLREGYRAVKRVGPQGVAHASVTACLPGPCRFPGPEAPDAAQAAHAETDHCRAASGGLERRLTGAPIALIIEQLPGELRCQVVGSGMC